jgi:choline dehydrogenase-like flavoprotein
MQAFRDALSNAWLARGERLTQDVYNGEINGLTHCADTIYKGVRSGSYLFLKDKPNITVISSVHSKRLIINKATRACTGVTVIAPSSVELRYATSEVILSQGVFESLKLLMLSGVGPAHELVKHGIELIVESRHVGQHLRDHPAVPFVLRVKDGFGMDDVLVRSGPRHDDALSAYRSNKSGPMGSGSGLLEMVGFPRIDPYLMRDPLYRQAKTSNGDRDPFKPQGGPHFELDFVCMFGSAFQWHYPVPKEGCYTTVVIDLVRPVSETGEVTLNSADPLEQPNINLNFFANDLDIIAMREGIRWTYDLLLKGDGFKDIVVDKYPWDTPLDADEEMKLSVLERSQTAFHPTGTARLSKRIDQGVVDPSSRSTASRISA